LTPPLGTRRGWCLFWHCIGSLLTLYWVSFDTVLGLFWHYIRSLMILY
jgi:hypothetical protein